jgi:Flp pilus assembly protein TadG
MARPFPALARADALLRRLSADRSGLALLEFAFAGPLVLALGLYGVEMGNQALTHMRVSQIALTIADNASRMGGLQANNIEQMREGDMNDVLQAARLQGAAIKLGTYGRVIVSSLENVQQSYDLVPVQRIHWQRCMGLKSTTGYTSSYGTTTTSAGTTATLSDAGTLALLGMGDAGRTVSAPPGSGVIFVEVNYQYQPIVSGWLAKPFRMHYVASMIVRNNRDFKQIYNPLASATPSTCNLYTT